MLPLQFHLVVNHVSLIGMPVALLFLSIGMIRHSDILKKTALYILIVMSLLVVPAYLSGEGAEELVEEMPSISKHQIHDHEDAAEFALMITLLAGGISLVTLLLWNTRFRAMALGSVVIVSVLAVVSLGVTAHEGGKIRRPELQNGLQKFPA